MNFSLLVEGLIEICISLITGVLIFFFSFKIFTLFTRTIDEIREIKKNNIAIGILLASFVFGIMFLIKTAIDPAGETLTNVMGTKGAGIMIILFTVLRILIIYIVSAIFAFLALWLAMNFFMYLTKNIDEMDEIGSNNFSVGMLIGTLVISVSIILSGPLSTMLRGLVPAARVGANEPILNVSNIIQGCIELAVSFFAVIFIFYFGFKIFSLLTKKINEVAELKDNNFAISILMSSFIFSMMLLINACIEPAEKTLEFAIGREAADVLIAVLVIICFFAVSALFAFIMLWIAMKGFMLLTVNIDEMAEIKKKNVAIAIIIAVLFVSIALLVANGLKLSLEAFIISPKFGSADMPVLPILR